MAGRCGRLERSHATQKHQKETCSLAANDVPTGHHRRPAGSLYFRRRSTWPEMAAEGPDVVGRGRWTGRNAATERTLTSTDLRSTGLACISCDGFETRLWSVSTCSTASRDQRPNSHPGSPGAPRPGQGKIFFVYFSFSYQKDKNI